MGQCVCKPRLNPPTVIKQITAAEVRTALTEYFGISGDHVYLADRNYGLYSLVDLQRFLEHDTIDKLSYITEGFDCDDFSDVLKGKERLWYRGAGNKLGSSFGTIWGDIRKESEPDKPRGHSVNYVILYNAETEKIQVQLIEPQNDKLINWVPGSVAWITVG